MKLKDIDAIMTSQTVVQSGLPELLRAEELKVVDELVSTYINGKLSDRDAVVGVAVIARIRRIFKTLQRKIDDGIEVGHKLTR